MKSRLLTVVVALLIAGLATSAIAQQTFSLKGVRSSQDYGPFPFRHGTVIKLESGLFKLNILADGRAFTLIDTDTKLAYGVYELVLGRMIDIGEVLFTITEVKAPATTTSGNNGKRDSFWNNTEFAIEMSLLHQTAYDWKINDAAGGDHDIMRSGATLKARKGIVILQLGLITDSEWDHTIIGDGETFENAEMAEGTGFSAALGMRIPVFKEGRWSGRIQGHASYRRESLSLTYGAWELESVTTITDTNAVTNSVIVTENLSYNINDESATLTEILVSLGMELAYTTPYLDAVFRASCVALGRYDPRCCHSL
jgi:hypothetical protein